MTAKYFRGQSFEISTKKSGSDYERLMYETSCTVALNTNLEDDSTKDDIEGWDKQIISSRNWTMSADIRALDNGTNIATLIKNWIDGGTISIAIDSTGNTAKPFSGTAILTQLDIDATVKQNVTASATWTGVGAIA